MMKAMKLAFARGFAFRTRQLVANGALAVFFLNLFLSVLKPCSDWNSDTLDAIVESAMLNDSTEYWISS